MAKSFSGGVADGLQDLRTQNAESDAWRKGLERDDAVAAERRAQRESARLSTENAVLKKQLEKTRLWLDERLAEVSGSLVVIKKVNNLIEKLPAEVQKSFRKNLITASIEEIRQIDASNRVKDNFIDIEGNFRNLSDRQQLGIFPPPKPPTTIVIPEQAPEPAKPSEVLTITRSKFLFGKSTKFVFENNEYETLEAANQQRDYALKQYVCDHSLWESKIIADEMIAERDFKKMHAAYNEWIEKNGGDSLA